MRAIFTRFLADEAGATSIEYAMIAVGIAIAIIVTVTSLGSKLNTSYTAVETALP